MSVSDRNYDALRVAKALIVDKGWIKDQLAIDDENNPIDPKSPKACRYCLGGAIFAAADWAVQELPSGDDRDWEYHNCIERLVHLLWQGITQDMGHDMPLNWSMSEWNDRNNRYKEDIVCALEAAIGRSKPNEREEAIA